MKILINSILVTAFLSGILGFFQSEIKVEQYQFILIIFISLAGIIGTNFKKK